MFLALMIVLQLAGSLLFPDRWTGAQGVLQAVGASLIAAAVYYGVIRVLVGASEDRSWRS
ncbi:hypothetical protein ACXET9_14050 [Brachybacterium sp. DNPG3]